MGALGLGNENNYPVPQEVSYFTELDEKITSVSSGMCHMGVCTGSGKLYLWGCNKYGQLGCLDIKNYSLLPNEEMNSKMKSQQKKSYFQKAGKLKHFLKV